MPPSTKAVYSAQKRCQEAINELRSFTVNKTKEELKTNSSMRILVHLRNDLLLQCNEMDSAYRNHNPGAGNENNTASQRLNMIVESTRTDIGQVLTELDNKLIQHITEAPNTCITPDRKDYQRPHTSFSQFHPERPTHSSPPRTQRILHTSSATGRNSQEPCTHTPRGGQPGQFTQTMAFRQASTTTTRHVPTSSSEVGHRGHLGVKSTFTRPMERQFTPQAALKRTNPDVVLKRSTTTTSTYKPGERWYGNTTSYPPGVIRDDYAGGRAPTTTKPQRVTVRQTLEPSSSASEPRRVVIRQIWGTNIWDITAPNMPATDGNSLENGDILKCHLCRHRVWGTWPFMQAHYREDHGYWPSSWSSLSSSPGPAQPRQEHDTATNA